MISLPAFRSKLPFAAAAFVALAALLACGERVRGITLNTLYLAVAVALVAVPAGMLVALLLTKTNLPGRRILLAAFGVLLFVPLYLHAAAWQAALGVSGWLTPPGNGLDSWAWIDGWRGTIWIHSIAAMPWVVCLVAAATRRTNGEAEAAASLSAPPWRVLWSITLPSLRPTIAIATLWTIVGVAVEMTVTDFFQIRTFAEEVYTVAATGGFQTDKPLDDYAPQSPWLMNISLAAGTLLLATIAFTILLSVYRYLREFADRPSSRTWRWELRRGGRWGAGSLVLLVLLAILGLPILALIYKTGLGAQQTSDGWQRVWMLSELRAELSRAPGSHYREALQSLKLGLAVASAVTLLGIAIGWRFRTARRWPVVLLCLLSLALAVPGPVLGLIVIRLLNHSYDSHLYWLTQLYDQTLLAPWLVQSVRLLPVASMAMAAGFAGVPTALIETARVEGARWHQQLLRIAFPLTWRTVLATWLMTFALSIGELAATILVMPPGRPTLAIHLFNLLHYGVEDQVSAVALLLLGLLMLIATAVVAIVGWRRST
ncbi:ABC transporter permease [Aeoliella mucimassa]|uniref:Sulfate transport system permease protein CysW n=1 Tax=Aeoliella mucimassa TaxID=2527972 RepID=A0A518AHV0_9BACT|nr:ABC transporter permease subunit [Aeoliella mucimassa]QDU54308.1 Sulfate transport system permease protein CysW [Aeoliella mucimassa]